MTAMRNTGLDHAYGVLLPCGTLFKQLITVFWKENLPQYAFIIYVFIIHVSWAYSLGARITFEKLRFSGAKQTT